MMEKKTTQVEMIKDTQFKSKEDKGENEGGPLRKSVVCLTHKQKERTKRPTMRTNRKDRT